MILVLFVISLFLLLWFYKETKKEIDLQSTKSTALKFELLGTM